MKYSSRSLMGFFCLALGILLVVASTMLPILWAFNIGDFNFGEMESLEQFWDLVEEGVISYFWLIGAVSLLLLVLGIFLLVDANPAKFSIRDVLLGMMVTGLALGWWVDHRRGELEADRLYKNWEESERFSQEQISAFEAALDDAKPGWRNADGSISFKPGPNGLRLSPGQNLPTSQAPARNPPKD